MPCCYNAGNEAAGEAMNHFTVEAFFDAEADVRGAPCGTLGIATDATDYAALTRRVRAVAPKMHVADGFGAQTANFRPAFIAA